MKSRRLMELKHFNSQLRKKSWKVYLDFLGVLLRSTNHPAAASLLQKLEERDYTGLVELADSLSRLKHETAADCLLLNQLSSVIRKYPFPEGRVAFDPQGEATKTFLSAEHKCKRVNQRFRAYLTVRDPHSRALDFARRWIAYVLGPFRLRDMYDDAGFGPGASIGCNGNKTNMARKLLAKVWTVTPGAYFYARAAFRTDPLIVELLLKEDGRDQYCDDSDAFNEAFAKRVRMVGNNKITFVPKTAKTHRTIAVEPLLNGFLQTGVDNMMRKRLMRVHINLRDQAENQQKARMGSLEGQSDPYVTIDLSSASDSVSTELCRYMLPPDWFDVMDQIRSRHYELDGTLHPFNKFVTMGNGFCFPLETILFSSLCQTAYFEASLTPDYTVYGDDIIVRKSVAPRVLELLRICGFTVNARKTFLDGPFRESCGADWFNGKDVRPIIVDHAFDSLSAIFNFVNTSRSKGVWEDIFYRANEFLVSLVPPSLLFVRPYKGNTDTALEVPLDEFQASPFSHWNANYQCWGWLELKHTAVPDLELQRLAGYDLALMRGMLTGSTMPSPFTVRRKTRTKIRKQAYCGACSTWLPSPDNRIYVGPLFLEQIELKPVSTLESELFDLATACG